MSSSQTLTREERLRSKKLISLLFSSSETHSEFSHPFKLIFLETDEANPTYPVQMAVTVPKRMHKYAVKRNLLKRRTKEAYRKIKPQLYKQMKDCPKMYAILFIYIAKEVEDYDAIQKGIESVIRKFIKTINRREV